MKEKEEQNNTGEERILNTVKNKKEIYKLKGAWIYKGLCLGLFIALLTVLGYCYVLYNKPKNEIPYVVEIDTSTGNQTVKNAVAIEKYTYTQDIMLATVRTYISNLRSVSIDKSVNRTNMKNVYAYSTKQANTYINSFYDEFSPNARCETERVEVYIYSTMPIAGSDELHFQCDWNEVVYNAVSNRVISENNYRADIIAKQYKPTAETKELNPLGFYITNIYVSEIKDGFIKK